MFCLLKDPDARISLPTAVNVKRYQDDIGPKYPDVKEVQAAADGLKLWVQKSYNYRIQICFITGGLMVTM